MEQTGNPLNKDFFTGIIERSLPVLKNFSFEGRTRRRDYWSFFLFYFGVIIVLAVVESIVRIRVLTLLFTLGVLIQNLALGARRLHDIGKSAWWLLVGLVPLLGGLLLLYFAVLDSQPGENKYGPNPKGV